MKTTLLLTSMLAMAMSAFAQNSDSTLIKTAFEMLSSNNPDTVAVRAILEECEAKGLKNADLCAAWSNYYMLLSNQQVDMVNLNPMFEKAILALDDGIAQNPSRLDIWMGKTYAYMQKKDYPKAFDNICQTIRQSKAIDNKWCWLGDEPLNERAIEAISSHSDYAVDMLNDGCPDLPYQTMDSLITYFPDYAMFKMVKGEMFAMQGEYETAIALLEPLKDEFKSDAVYLVNMALIYDKSGQLEKMEQMCLQIEATGDDEAISIARELRDSHVTLSIDFEEIKSYALKNKKELKMLTDRFVKGDQSLSLEEVCRVYFGHAADKKNCKPLWDRIDQPRELFESEKYKECFELSEKALKLHPVSLAANVYAFLSLRSISEDDARLETYYNRFSSLVNMIMKGAHSLKEGDSDHPVYSILWRDDENVFVDYFLNQQSGKKPNSYLFTNPVYFLFELEK